MPAHDHDPRPGPAPDPAAPAPLTRHLWHLLKYVAEARADRRRLAAFDERALQDLRITRGEALRESRRPWWDLPEASPGRPGRSRRLGDGFRDC